MSYYLDLEKITIDDYRKKLAAAYLLPSRMILKENLGERFGYFKSIGIKNTENLYNQIVTKSGRQKLADSTGIDCQEILELAKLADLSRIKWVGATYARMLYDLGLDTVKKVSESDPIDLHTRINKFVKENNIFKGQIGLNDVKILVEFAAELK